MKIFKLSQAEIRTSDCVAAIVANPQFSNTNPKDWKRQSKKLDENYRWVRTFINNKTGQQASVTEISGQLLLSPDSINPEQNNPSNKISFLPLQKPSTAERSNKLEWTGQMVFSIEDTDDDRVGFIVGPETLSGGIDDSYDGGAEQKILKLFSEFDVDLAAENYYEINITDAQEHDPSITKKKLSNLIKQRLLSAHAKPYTDRR